MNTITTFDLSAYFYNAKREKFLRNYYEALKAYKWFSGYGNTLTPEQEAERLRRSLKAIDLANKIKANRIERMRNDGVLAEMDRITNTLYKY